MRYVIALVFLAIASAAQADNLQGRVFGYECKHIDPSKDGFSCALETDGYETRMKLHFTQDITKLSTEEQEYKKYRYDATVLRFLQLGGKFFVLTYAHAPSTKKMCSSIKNQPLSYHCE